MRLSVSVAAVMRLYSHLWNSFHKRMTQCLIFAVLSLLFISQDNIVLTMFLEHMNLSTGPLLMGMLTKSSKT